MADFRADGTKTVYLENYRTPGAAGAWNTALSWLQGTEPSSFVAILDDDDAWAPTYLESCEEMASEGCLDMVAAGIIYHKSSKYAGRPLTVPDRLGGRGPTRPQSACPGVQPVREAAKAA